MKYYKDSPMDIAHWLTLSMLNNGVPSVKYLMRRHELSKPTAYRWRTWALDKYEAMRAAA